MKILIVTPYLGSIYGGTSKVIKELAQEFGNLDIAVDIITTNANGAYKLDVPIQCWIQEKGYRVQYFSCWHRNDLIISSSLLDWLFNHVGEYNLVHTNTIFAPIILLTHWVCKLRNVPYIITPHGMLEPWAMSYKAWKKYFYYTLFEKPALQQTSAIHVLGISEANSVKSLGFRHTIIVPNGIHKREFELLPAPVVFYQHFPATQDKVLLLFLGRIDPKKGLDLLALAFAKVHKQFPNTHLVVAGPDSIGFLPTVQSYFLQAGCLDAVTFTGMLTGSLKYAAFAAASLYVAPSYSEGLSMSVLEGMASGVPCIITTGCNFPEAAEAFAAHVVKSDANALADALTQCLNNPLEAREMGERARKFIFQNYTWEQAAQKLKQAYHAILGEKYLPKSLINS